MPNPFKQSNKLRRKRALIRSTVTNRSWFAIIIITFCALVFFVSIHHHSYISKQQQAEKEMSFLSSINIISSSSSSSWCDKISKERANLYPSLHINYPCINIPPNTKSAIVTFLTAGVEEGKQSRTIYSGQQYINGVLALGASLSKHLTRTDTIQLLLISKGFTLPTIEQTKLEKVGWIIGEAPDVQIDSKYVPRFARYKTTYTKTAAIGLSEFKCVLLMDADTLVVGNIDDLLSCHVFYDDYSNNDKSNQYKVAGTLDYYHKRWYHFNTGSILWNTSTDEMNRVYDLTKNESFMTRFESDQIFLNTVYPDRTDVKKNELMVDEGIDGNREHWGQVVNLGWKYNVQTHLEVQNPKFWKDHFDGMKIIHYTEKKGWQCPEQYELPPSDEVMSTLKNCERKDRDEMCFCGLGYLWWDALKLAKQIASVT